MDGFGNINAREGCDRCACGCKYWEDDKCVSCGMLWEVRQIQMQADIARYMNEVKLNVMLTTWESQMGFTESAHSLDLVTTTNKYRMMGVIQ
jgi:hypothetical protein